MRPSERGTVLDRYTTDLDRHTKIYLKCHTKNIVKELISISTNANNITARKIVEVHYKPSDFDIESNKPRWMSDRSETTYLHPLEIARVLNKTKVGEPGKPEPRVIETEDGLYWKHIEC